MVQAPGLHPGHVGSNPTNPNTNFLRKMIGKEKKLIIDLNKNDDIRPE